jgi:hypothetical protein
MDMGNLNERESGISKVIASSERDRVAVLNFFKKQFDNQVPANWESLKTPNEIRTAEIVLDEMLDFVKMYGGEMPPVTQEHIHSVSESDRDEHARAIKGGAGYLPDYQRLYTVDSYGNSNFLKGHVLAHELLHFCSFQSYSAREQRDVLTMTPRRHGLEMINTDNTGSFFGKLDEAVIEELAITFSTNHLTKNEWLRKDLEEHEGYSSNVLEITKDKNGNAVFVSHAYEQERTSLRYLVNDLFEKNQDQFNAPDEVFLLFAKGALTGNVLELARLIEKTYGKGWFRKIGEMTK